MPGCSGWRACGTGAARPCGTACLPRQRPAPAVRMRAILGVAACAHAGAALAPSVKRSCLCACHLSYKHVEGVPCACQRPVLFANSHCLAKQGLSQLADPPAPPYRQVLETGSRSFAPGSVKAGRIAAMQAGRTACRRSSGCTCGHCCRAARSPRGRGRSWRPRCSLRRA